MSTDETTRPRLDAIEARYSAPSAILAEVGWHATRDIPALTAALRGVLALHVPHPERQRMVTGVIVACSECGDIDDSPTEYPCPTVRAITAHIDVEGAS